jgi:hypothetical protein
VVQSICTGDAVMIVREFEAWLLFAFNETERTKVGATSPERIRDAKGKLGRLVPKYKPSTHQLEITRKVDIAKLRLVSESFDKLVRSLGVIFTVTPPEREML